MGDCVYFGAQCHYYALNRGSYMSAHVLLNLLNELRKRDKFYEFNKFNNTGAPLLDYIYHMTLRLL